MSLFDTLTLFPEDPILSLPINFAADPRPNKVNLGIGSYRDSDGHPYLLDAVRKAQQSVIGKERNKEYLPIDGDPTFLKAAREMIFSPELLSQYPGGIFSCQCVGGTSALRLGGEFLNHEISRNIYLPSPTWPNHQQIFSYSGMQVHHYRYYDDTIHTLDFDGMCYDIVQMPPGSTILLHANCHNPTGMDPTPQQWEELSVLIKKHHLIPFFDFAYQGFKDSVDADAKAIRNFAKNGHDMLVANSFSKNFGLYNERVGTLTVLTQNKGSIKTAASQLKQMVRSNFSNPPKHGAAIITEILTTDSLKAEWLKELGNMRERLRQMRHTLISGLQTHVSDMDWEFLNRQCGFFSFSGLNEHQVHRMIKGYAIYMPTNGRINVAGLNAHNMDYVIQAISDVTRP